MSKRKKPNGVTSEQKIEKPTSPASADGAQVPGTERENELADLQADGAAPGGLEAAEVSDPGIEDPDLISETTDVDIAGGSDIAGGTDIAADLETAEIEAEAKADDAVDAAAADAAEVDAGEEMAIPAEQDRLESIVMSLLFAADRPLTVADFKRLLAERDGKRITTALESLRDRHAESGVQLVALAGGWQLRTHPANGPWVAKLVAGRPQRLSRALMETLAIVAYRQPITRPEIDEIRGVDCGPVLRTLLDRNLIRVIGKKEEVGRPILYGTTPEFLKTFSL